MGDNESGDNEFLSTRELASMLRVEPQTIRRSFCVKGHYLGIVPLKLPNGRSLYSKSAAKKLVDASTQR